jgi:hypothetical protein
MMLIPLSQVPERPYGSLALMSKYQDDSGGPSQWWRDRLIDNLLQKYPSIDVLVVAKVISMFDRRDDGIVSRLDAFIRNLRHGEITSAEDLLERFGTKERHLHRRDRFVTWAIGAIVTVSAGTTARNIIPASAERGRSIVERWSSAEWSFLALLTVSSLLCAWWTLFRDKPSYMIDTQP